MFVDHLTLSLTLYSQHEKKNKKVKHTLIEGRRIPPTIEVAVDAIVKDFARLQNLSKGELNQRDTYYQTVGLLFASMYCSPQGRIHALKVLKLRDVHDIYEKGSTLADEFKTSSKFGYQPILFTSLAKSILTFFLDDIRPGLEQTYPVLLLPSSLLFPSLVNPETPVDSQRQMSNTFSRLLGKFTLTIFFVMIVFQMNFRY